MSDNLNFRTQNSRLPCVHARDLIEGMINNLYFFGAR